MTTWKTLLCTAVLTASAAVTAYAQSSIPRQIFVTGTTFIQSMPVENGEVPDLAFDPTLIEGGIYRLLGARCVRNRAFTQIFTHG
jgi:hypothetical protein